MKVQTKIKIKIKSIENKGIVNLCDICNERLNCLDAIQERVIDVEDELNNSYESEVDKHEPWLLLCDYCIREYQIPSYC
jgi:hypothetical protein